MTDIARISRIEREEPEDKFFEVGQWYQVKNDEKKGGVWLGCIIHVGSNFVKIRGVSDEYGSHYQQRFLFTEMDEWCIPEPNAEVIIQINVEKYQREVQRLMEDVKLLTSQLSLDPRKQLEDGSGETQALSIRGNSQPIEEYKTSLIKAQKETLPDIFKKIGKANEKMAEWMKAPLIPLKASAEGLETVIKLIENRIFNVELYAGLVEEVEQIKEGTPASIETPIHIFQRRAYMDEECLAQYKAGGMEFEDIGDFDKWIIKKENLDRLLPHPRCILAFRVRRYTKEREAFNISQFIKMWYKENLDKTTFLYIRNGEQVFRLTTGIEFGKQLFPDVERSNLDGKIYAKMFAGNVQHIIGENEYIGLKESYQKARQVAAEKAKELKKKKVPESDWWRHMNHHGFSWKPRESDFHGDYIEWSPDNVYYDEISEYVQAQIDKHNRLVLVLQGLLDRSPVFHPHPPYQLWTLEGFSQAFQLIYDTTRGLVAGDAPDFEAYRAKLNESLQAGSLTVGQQQAWLESEAEKENARRSSDYRWNSYDNHLTTFQPYGNPGPGYIAQVERISKKRGLIYKWTRDRVNYNRYGNNSEINCWFTVEKEKVLNVSAYTPGDFKIFFEDPRTRADYIQWAPLLLGAEDYYAKKKGKKK
jgi:hypothetical protein